MNPALVRAGKGFLNDFPIALGLGAQSTVIRDWGPAAVLTRIPVVRLLELNPVSFATCQSKIGSWGVNGLISDEELYKFQEPSGHHLGVQLSSYRPVIAQPAKSKVQRHTVSRRHVLQSIEYFLHPRHRLPAFPDLERSLTVIDWRLHGRVQVGVPKRFKLVGRRSMFRLCFSLVALFLFSSFP